MILTLRTFSMIGILGIFLIGIGGCGQKHLQVSTTSGKADEQAEMTADVQDASSDRTGLENLGLAETGLGNESDAGDSEAQDSALAAAEPAASQKDDSADGLQSSEMAPTTSSSEDAIEGDTSQLTQAMIPADLSEEAAAQPSSESVEDLRTPSSSQTAMDTVSTQDEGTSGSPEPQDESPLLARGAAEDKEPAQSSDMLPSDTLPDDSRQPFGESSQDQAGLMEAQDVEGDHEKIEVAKAMPSDSIDKRIGEIREQELATAAAGLQDVFFEFDSWKITTDGKQVLEQSAGWLQEESARNLLIEGHCDQRGTQAYNIVLGKKRAIAIRDYLVELGIEPSRLSVITYGKEKPFCADSTEVCYQLNRRGHLLVLKP